MVIKIFFTFPSKIFYLFIAEGFIFFIFYPFFLEPVTRFLSLVTCRL